MGNVAPKANRQGECPLYVEKTGSVMVKAARGTRPGRDVMCSPCRQTDVGDASDKKIGCAEISTP
jgi:hypothetical protein